MGLRSWLRERAERARSRSTAAAEREEGAPAARREREIAPGCPASAWDELPAYLPVDPKEHTAACVIASAIAAGDAPESSWAVRCVSVANPEHRRVACIATALAAGALESSSFAVKRIYKYNGHENLENDHAA